MCAPYAVLWCMGPGEGGGGRVVPPRRAQWGVGRLWQLPVPEGGVLGVRA